MFSWCEKMIDDATNVRKSMSFGSARVRSFVEHRSSGRRRWFGLFDDSKIRVVVVIRKKVGCASSLHLVVATAEKKKPVFC